MKPYSLIIVICFAITLGAGFLLLNQNQQVQPLQVQDNTPTSSVLITSSRDRVWFPAQCVFVTWQLEGIREAYLNSHGKIGQGAEESCTVGTPPTFRVIFQDGREVFYELPVTQTYNTALGLITLVGFIAGLSSLVGLLIGPRALLIVLVVVIFGPLLRAQVNLGQDYLDHDMFATIALDNARALPPHFLYHVSAIALYESHLVPNIENAGFVVMLLAQLSTALATYQLLHWLNHRREGLIPISGYMWVAAVLALMLLGPISILEDNLRPGQANSFLFANTYHNPTVNMLKPLAILLFLVILNLMQTAQRRRLIWLAVAAAIFTVLSTLAKPNYTIAIVPAITLVIAYSFLRPLRIPRIGLVAAVIIPAAVVLIWQFTFLYGAGHTSLVRGDNSSIIFAPFDYFVTINQVPFDWLLLDLVASILFPALIYIVYWRETRYNTALNLSWLVFLITLAQAYFFNESPDGSHGNLTWGTQIGLFILFAVSVEYFGYKVVEVIRNHQPINWPLAASGIALAAHLVNRVVVLVAG